MHTRTPKPETKYLLASFYIHSSDTLHHATRSYRTNYFDSQKAELPALALEIAFQPNNDRPHPIFTKKRPDANTDVSPTSHQDITANSHY